MAVVFSSPRQVRSRADIPPPRTRARRRERARSTSPRGPRTRRRSAPSEPELDAELDHSRATPGSRDLAEIRGADIPTRITERWSIRDVVRLEPELQRSVADDAGHLG